MVDDGSRPSRRRPRFLRSLLLDVTPLRTRAFRWLYIGQIGAILARQILVVAVPYQIFVLTESSLLVGAIGLAQLGPLLVFSAFGGAAVDAFDRRKMLAIVQVLMGLTAIALAMNTSLGGRVWPIFLLVAFNAGLAALESPTRTAIVPSVISRDKIAAAFALHIGLHELAQVVGPAVAGIVMATFGITPAYWMAAAAGLLGALALIPLGPQKPEGATGRVTFAAVIEGWRYVRKQPLLRQTMLVDFSVMVFAMPRALFPALGAVVLGGDAATVGLLYAAPGAGALVAALTTGWVSSVRRQGRAIILAIGVYGVSVVAFGLSRTLGVALVALAIGGGADVVSNIFRNSLLQLAVPDQLRGRVTAFKDALAGGGPQIGDARAGAVATAVTPAFSLISGGLLSLVGTGLIAWRGRELWNYSVDDELTAP
jgi:hypothetical protein